MTASSVSTRCQDPASALPSAPAMVPRLTARPAGDVAFLHGLLEGIARVDALGYQPLIELGGPPVLTIGGGAANPVWTVIARRVLGVPVLVAAAAEAAHGAAILARAALLAAKTG